MVIKIPVETLSPHGNLFQGFALGNENLTTQKSPVSMGGFPAYNYVAGILSPYVS